MKAGRVAPKKTLALLALGAFAGVALSAAAAGTSPAQAWIAHADAVFEAADAANLALARERAAREAWVLHADAVFASADAENLAKAGIARESHAWIAHADAVFEAADAENLRISRALVARTGY
ncbi:MAG: hypothetical protein IPH30_15835 [Betaproteobacteria bacterium]|jgi:hypothetical protein|nr:hypothetical protein [Betaproteobacteria bacterium]